MTRLVQENSSSNGSTCKADDRKQEQRQMMQGAAQWRSAHPETLRELGQPSAPKELGCPQSRHHCQESVVPASNRDEYSHVGARGSSTKRRRRHGGLKISLVGVVL